MDKICSKNIDTEAFYADTKSFEQQGIDPQTTPCDYCIISHGNGCPFNC